MASSFLKFKTLDFAMMLSFPFSIMFSLQSILLLITGGFPSGASEEEPACQCRRQETQVQSLGWEDTLEEGMATHSSILAWRIPWTEEPGGLQSMEWQRVTTEAT